MSAHEWIWIIAGGLIVWFVVSGLTAAAWSTVAGRIKRRRATPPPPADDTVISDWRPEVPPTRSELAWLRDQPVEILRGSDLRARFDDVIDSARRAEQVQR